MTAHGSTPAFESALSSRELCAFFNGWLVHADFIFGDFWKNDENCFRFDTRNKLWLPPKECLTNARKDGSEEHLRRLILRIDATCCLLATPATWPESVCKRLYEFLQVHCLLLVSCEERASGPTQTSDIVLQPSLELFPLIIMRNTIRSFCHTKNSSEVKILNFLIRTLTMCSNNRAFSLLLQKEIENEETCRFVRDCLWKTLTGAYRNARPPVGIRSVVSLARFRCMTLDDFRVVVRRLQKHTSPVLVASLQEFFFREIEDENVVCQIFRDRCGQTFDHMRMAVFSACDILRQVVTETLYDRDVAGAEVLPLIYESQCAFALAFIKAYRRFPRTRLFQETPQTPCKILIKRKFSLLEETTANAEHVDFAKQSIAISRKMFRDANSASRAAMATVWSSDNDWKKKISCLIPKDVHVVRNFVSHLLSFFCIRLISLPPSLCQLQRKGLQKRFGEDLLQDDDFFNRVTSFVCCLKCYTVKNFCAHGRNEKKPHNVAKSHGFLGIATTDDGILVCQSRRPQHQSGACGQVGLTSVPFFVGEEGRGIVFLDKFYLLTPCCGHICIVSALSVFSDGSFLCTQCQQIELLKKKKKSKLFTCMYCLESISNGVKLMIEDEGVTRECQFCRRHARNWFKQKRVWNKDEITKKLFNEGLFKKEGGALKKCFYG